MSRSESRRRFTLWLYDDLALEKEIASYLEGLDRYRRAEVLRNLVKDGWGMLNAPHHRTSEFSNHSTLSSTVTEPPRQATEQVNEPTQTPLAKKPQEATKTTTAAPVEPKEPIEPMLIEKLHVEPQEAQSEVIDPLAALMELE